MGVRRSQDRYYNPVDGAWHHYHPDFLIKQRNKGGVLENILVEVKPLHEVFKPTKKRTANAWNIAVRKWITNRAKWLAAIAWCEKNNTRFMVATKENGYDRFRLITESKLRQILEENGRI